MKRKIIVFSVLLIFFISPGIIGTNSDFPTAFSVNILTFYSGHARNQWSLLIEQTLPKIGIGVTGNVATSLSQISQRTWAYPFESYEYIPHFSLGGFDMLFTTQFSDIDWNPSNLFSTKSFPPYGNNFYQYSNPEWDKNLDEYLTTNESNIMRNKGEKLQTILYEDLPSICIIYPKPLVGFKFGISDVDFLLLSFSSHRSENWTDVYDNEITYCLPDFFYQPNVFRLSSYNDKLWMQTIYGSLFQRVQINHDWVPVIAKDYDLSTDGLDLTINLDPNAKFSDGSLVTAEDVFFTYKLHMTPKVKSPQYGVLSQWFESNNSIEIVDSDTVIFHLKKKYNLFLSLCSLGLIDRSAVEPYILSEGYEIFNNEPLSSNASRSLLKSCGPFVIDSYSDGDTVNLTPNLYWNNLTCANGDPQLTELHFRCIKDKNEALNALLANEVDILDFHYYPDWTDFEGIPSLDTELVFQAPVYEELAINMKHPVLGTGELTPIGTPVAARWIRKAISYAIPRKIIVEEILNGLGNPGVVPMPDVLEGFDESLSPYGYDLDEARTCMENAGLIIPDNLPHYDTILLYEKKTKPILILFCVILFLSVTSMVLVNLVKEL